METCTRSAHNDNRNRAAWRLEEIARRCVGMGHWLHADRLETGTPVVHASDNGGSRPIFTTERSNVGTPNRPAASITFTDPLGYRGASPRLASHRRRIEQRLSVCGFTQYTFIKKPGQALDAALRLPHPIAITGSFPLLRELYPLARRLAR
jgi:hypothetical protein